MFINSKKVEGVEQMKKYSFSKAKNNNFILFIFLFSMLYIGRDTLVSDNLLGFTKSQFISIVVFTCMIIIFLYTNRREFRIIKKDFRIKLLVFCTLFMFFLFFIKSDYQLMYFSILFCIYFSVFLTFILDFKGFSKLFVLAICLLSVYSILCTYILKYFISINLIDISTFKNVANTEFYNFIFSFVVTKEGYFRNFSIFREPGVFQFFIIVALYLNNYIIDYKKTSYKYLNNSILFITMLSTFSTNGVIELFLFCIFIFFDKKLYKNRKIILSMIMILIVLFAVLFKVMGAKGDLYWTLYSQFNKLLYLNESMLPRLNSIAVDLNIFIHNPILGADISEVMYAVNHNTSSTLILFAILGFFGGCFNMVSWLAVLWNKKRNIILNLLIIIIFFMAFNTQNLVTNIFFWTMPVYGIINKLNSAVYTRS